jgi:class 3 adenylate cyclase
MHHVLRSAPVVMPTGTVTLLFTDIVGSTRLWEQDATDTAELVARHDAVVRGAIDAHGGVVFATLGDGFAAAFRQASDAVAAVILAQRTLVGGEDGALLVPVRMGLHTGEAIEVDADYRGPAVNRAARIMVAGHGGQILVPTATTWWMCSAPSPGPTSIPSTARFST